MFWGGTNWKKFQKWAEICKLDLEPAVVFFLIYSNFSGILNVKFGWKMTKKHIQIAFY